MSGSRVRVFEHGPGDWWAECLVCGAWVTTTCPDRRTAEQRFGRHWQHDHGTDAVTSLRDHP